MTKDKSMDKKAEKCIEDLEKKLKNLPIPVTALGDGICITVVLMILVWIASYFQWMENTLSWAEWGYVAGIIFIVSMIIRFITKKK